MRLLIALLLAGCGFSEVKTDLGGSDAAPSPDLTSGSLDLAGVTVDLAGADLAAPSAHARVFVSRNAVPGDMNSSLGGAPGLLGADLLCLQYATAGHLGSTWRAWMSDSSTNAINRVLGAGPWYRTDDTLAFPDRNTLVRGPLVPINRDELGAAVPVHSAVWTASTGLGGSDLNAGLAGNGDCNEWTTTATMTWGLVGDSDETSGGQWSDIDEHLCDTGARLYCFESP